jgi:hypothetical protein
VEGFGATRSSTGPGEFPHCSKEREDEYGEEGEEEGEQEGRTAQEEEVDEGVGQEDRRKESDEEGGSQAQGAGKEAARRSDPSAGACSVLDASRGIGDGRRR